MRTITRTFQEISVKAVHKWTDENGKKRQKTKTFSQTLNPYNRNPDGSIRTKADIYSVICAERDAWMEKMRNQPRGDEA